MQWVEFLTDNHIAYVTRGPNTKKGEVSVKCPWCGEDDPSEHLGINLTTNAWGCLRNQAHRGKSVTYLIQGLLHCSGSQAGLIVSQYDQADPDTLEQALAALGAPEPPRPAPEKLVMPMNFRPVLAEGSARRFCTYLKKRGFYDPVTAARVYRLRCCTTGEWKDRLIFPVYQNHRLTAWTGRALGSTMFAPRYLSTSAIKTGVFNEDELMFGGRNLFITEGPIDALKVDYYGQYHGGRATCVFGTSISMDQIAILKKLSKQFSRTILLLDPDALESAFNINEWLPDAIVGTLPSGCEDPGALTMGQVIDLVRNF